MRLSPVVLSLACFALARPTESLEKRQDFLLKNGQDAIALNTKFQTLNANSPCQAGENACLNGGFVQCVNGKFVGSGCAPGTVCAALPLVNAPGTTIACTTAADRDARIAATGAKPGGNNAPPPPINNTPPAPPAGGIPPGNNTPNTGGGDPQTSLTLDPAVVAKGFNNNGQSNPDPGQVPSLTSTNNFINFCKTVNLPITNGAQIPDGSCNPAPMGVMPSRTKMPASKFVFPSNLAKIPAKQQFTIKMAIQNLETGNFVNPNQNYFAAPQQLGNGGVIKGHSHVVIQKLESMGQTKPVDPTIFQFFKGLNSVAQGGILTADVTAGLDPGVYRMASINSASNHQPVLAPVAQHGSLDDAVYFTVE